MSRGPANDLRREKSAIAARLLVARVRSKVSLEDAAEAAGVEVSAIEAWERGRTLPCLVQFRDLMAVYGESPYRVLFGRSMFGFNRAELDELTKASRRLSPSLQRKLELMVAVQMRPDLDETVV